MCKVIIRVYDKERRVVGCEAVSGAGARGQMQVELVTMASTESSFSPASRAAGSQGKGCQSEDCPRCMGSTVH